MSYEIECLSTIRVSSVCVINLFQANTENDLGVWDDEDEVSNGIDSSYPHDQREELSFEIDHDYDDWLGPNPQLLDVLEKHKVNGDITFMALYNFTPDKFWGYRFKDGVMTKLVGEVVFKEKENDE